VIEIMKLVECVPNFSEGRNMDIINAITKEIESIEEVMLLDVDPGIATNRTVVTFAGSPEKIKIAAFNAIKKAAELIDMSKHRGEHSRIGATDVCPFVPVSEVTMEECVEIAKEVGKRVGEELGIPVYLYEEAARKPERKLLSNIRKGEYEGLEEKLKNPEWKPDYGEAKFNARLGAIVTGARFFLIAYNVNLKSPDVKYAKEIGEVLRESGRPKRDENGNVVKVNGETVKIPGRLKTVQGMGVTLEKYNITQVSMNLKNYNVTPIHVAFEEVKKEAERLGVEVTGSEIVGLVPLEALLQAGDFYCNGKYKDEKSLVEIAVEKLGLSELNEFIPNQKIIDYMI